MDFHIWQGAPQQRAHFLRSRALFICARLLERARFYLRVSLHWLMQICMLRWELFFLTAAENKVLPMWIVKNKQNQGRENKLAPPLTPRTHFSIFAACSRLADCFFPLLESICHPYFFNWMLKVWSEIPSSHITAVIGFAGFVCLFLKCFLIILCLVSCNPGNSQRTWSLVFYGCLL